MSFDADLLVRLAGSFLAPGGKRAKLSIVAFHRVLPCADPMRPDVLDVGEFTALVQSLARSFSTFTLGQAMDRLGEGTLPRRSVVLTFDDGYRDNVELALPVLSDYGVPATFFVSTGYLNGADMWNDLIIEGSRGIEPGVVDLEDLGLGSPKVASWADRRKIAEDVIGRLKHLHPEERERRTLQFVDSVGAQRNYGLMMDESGVCKLAKSGMEIGAHTVTHPILASVSDDEAWREISTGKQVLEDITQGTVRSFAYPNGRPVEDYSNRHAEMVSKSGFDAAVSTAPGVVTQSSDVFQLPRFTPWDRGPFKFGARLLMNCALGRGGL